MTSTSEATRPGGPGPSDGDERSSYDRHAGTGLHRTWAERPLPPPGEAAAGAAQRRAPGPWRAPALVAVLAYVAVALTLIGGGWLLVHSGAGEPLRSWDESISRELSTGRTSGWNDYSDLGTSGANTVPVVLAMVVVSAVLALLRRWRDLLLVPLALGLELSIFLTVNYVVARERPDVAQLGGEPGTHSFPSGHVAATFVLWFGIVVLLGAGRWRWPWRWLAWAFAAVPVVSVAFSRVYRGMHFTTDVIAGALLGAAALCASAVATRSSWLGGHRRHPGRGDSAAPDDRLAGAGADTGRVEAGVDR